MTPQAKTQEVRDQLVAVLGNAYPQALSTPQVLLDLRTLYGCDQPGGCNAVPLESCRAWCWYGRAYPQLRALAEMGLATWQPSNRETRLAHWRHVLPPGEYLPGDVVELD